MSAHLDKYHQEDEEPQNNRIMTSQNTGEQEQILSVSREENSQAWEQGWQTSLKTLEA